MRFKFIKCIPVIIVDNYFLYVRVQREEGTNKELKLSQVASFIRMIEKLLMRAKGDKTDSIKIEA